MPNEQLLFTYLRLSNTFMKIISDFSVFNGVYLKLPGTKRNMPFNKVTDKLKIISKILFNKNISL